MLAHLRTRFPILFGCFILFFGIFIAEHFGIYDHVAHFDKIMHVLGGLAVGWVAMALLQNDIARLPWYKQLLIITSIACFVGVVWEFAEHLANGLRYSHPMIYRYYHGGDLTDTLGDILADIIGGALFALWALWRERN